MQLFLFALVTLVANLAQSANVRVDPLVLTSQGLVRGQKASDGDYSSFLGIPYATVDAENPFGASLEAPTFEGVFNAYDGSVHCPQASTKDDGVLDCLDLNIFTPNQASSRNPVAVLVWIHGGDFQSGKAPTEHVYSIVKHDIVLVTINYRLGAYGFMCLDSPLVPGNQGLKDQETALQWVKNNIAAFGGNPYNITVAGMNAGATSVNLHLYLSKEKLFQKAIIQSGVAQTSSLFDKGDPSAATTLSSYLGFNASDDESAIKFLASTAPNLVSAATVELGFNFKMCKETSFSGVENFLYANPATLSYTKYAKNVPIMIGVSSHEIEGTDTDDASFSQLLKKQFEFSDDDLHKALALIKHFYIGDGSFGSDLQHEADELVCDFSINHPLERELKKLEESGAGPVYEFVFDFMNYNDMDVKRNELQYMFADEATFDDVQKHVSSSRSNLVANFVKYGNPTPETSELVPTWEPITADSRPYLRMGGELTLEHRYRQQSMAFWDLFYQAHESRVKAREYNC